VGHGPLRPQKITFGEMRASGVRGLLVYCADFRCSHWNYALELQNYGDKNYGDSALILERPPLVN